MSALLSVTQVAVTFSAALAAAVADDDAAMFVSCPSAPSVPESVLVRIVENMSASPCAKINCFSASGESIRTRARATAGGGDWENGRRPI